MAERQRKIILARLENPEYANQPLYICKICGAPTVVCDNPQKTPYIGLISHFRKAHRDMDMTWDDYIVKFGIPQPVILSEMRDEE